MRKYLFHFMFALLLPNALGHSPGPVGEAVRASWTTWLEQNAALVSICLFSLAIVVAFTLHNATRWRFDVQMTLLILWAAAGLFFDGWAHTHGRADTSFFTPYHAIFYSGLISVLTLFALKYDRKKPWKEALPHGYHWSAIGAVIFLIAGGGDMVWHMLFGIEAEVDALLSPTHLLLLVGGLLLSTGPVRAALQHKYTGWHKLWPAILTTAAFFSFLTFFMMYGYFISGLFGLGQTGPGPIQELSAAGMMISAIVITGILLFLERNFRLSLGMVTTVVGLNAIAMGFVRIGEYPLLFVLTMILSGILLDALAFLLPLTNVRNVRIFAFLVPFVLYLPYLATGFLSVGIWWSTHMSAGVAFLAGIYCYLLSMLVVRPYHQR